MTAPSSMRASLRQEGKTRSSSASRTWNTPAHLPQHDPPAVALNENVVNAFRRPSSITRKLSLKLSSRPRFACTWVRVVAGLSSNWPRRCLRTMNHDQRNGVTRRVQRRCVRRTYNTSPASRPCIANLGRLVGAARPATKHHCGSFLRELSKRYGRCLIGLQGLRRHESDSRTIPSFSAADVPLGKTKTAWPAALRRTRQGARRREQQNCGRIALVLGMFATSYAAGRSAAGVKLSKLTRRRCSG
ncbi:hypothetical protein C8Q79DRAFT_70365 [Trametes meyenii]|nr:hypothetical protein C8Q79DRAFT_70365 [Trametes meyenii]